MELPPVPEDPNAPPPPPPELTDEQIKELKEGFALFDRDADGEIQPHEVGMVMRYLGQNPTEADLFAITEEIESDFSDTVKLDKFLKMMKLRYKPRDPTQECVREGFREFDVDGEGVIPTKELKNILENMGEKFSKEEMAEFLKEADPNETGEIHYEEFINQMIKKDKL